MANLTLDLHGRLLEEAIAEVTMYFDRIRRSYSAITPASAASPNSLNVTIVTGKGSHSAQGPVLRSAVQKLLVKRGMTFSIEQGKGAFKVDALSGWDLYAAEAATCSKVLLSSQQEFQMMALSKKLHGASFQQAATGNSAPTSKPTRKNNGAEPSPRKNSGPLPKQVLLEEDAVRSATQLSLSEAQKQKAKRNKLKQKQKLDMKKAIEQSQVEYAVNNCFREDEEAELQRVLALSSREIHENITDAEYDELKLATEQSLLAEQARKKQEDKKFEEELQRALEQSAEQERVHQKPSQSHEELDLLKILKLSSKEKEAADMSEEKALERAIRLSQHDELNHDDDVLLNETKSLLLDGDKVALDKKFTKIDSVDSENSISSDLILSLGQQQRVRVTDAAWYYVDPQQNTQGPFEPDLMRAWLAAGYFGGDLRISQNRSGPFFSLSTYFPFYLSSAFHPDQ